MKWSLQHIKALQTSGKIRGFAVSDKVPKSPIIGGRKAGKHFQRRSMEKDFISWYLFIWCQDHGIPLETEYYFHPERRWHSDWAIILVDFKVLVEYEGLMSEKSGHTTVTGYTGNTDKYNAAAALGFHLIRFTALNYRTVGIRIFELYNFHLKKNDHV